MICRLQSAQDLSYKQKGVFMLKKLFLLLIIFVIFIFIQCELPILNWNDLTNWREYEIDSGNYETAFGFINVADNGKIGIAYYCDKLAIPSLYFASLKENGKEFEKKKIKEETTSNFAITSDKDNNFHVIELSTSADGSSILLHWWKEEDNKWSDATIDNYSLSEIPEDPFDTPKYLKAVVDNNGNMFVYFKAIETNTTSTTINYEILKFDFNEEYFDPVFNFGNNNTPLPTEFDVLVDRKTGDLHFGLAKYDNNTIEISYSKNHEKIHPLNTVNEETGFDKLSNFSFSLDNDILKIGYIVYNTTSFSCGLRFITYPPFEVGNLINIPQNSDLLKVFYKNGITSYFFISGSPPDNPVLYYFKNDKKIENLDKSLQDGLISGYFVDNKGYVYIVVVKKYETTQGINQRLILITNRTLD